MKDSPKGNGAKALQEVCDLADKYGEVLSLQTYFPALFPYYEQFGFECFETFKRTWDNQTREFKTYVRNPKPKLKRKRRKRK